MHRKAIVANKIALFLLASSLAFGAGDKTRTKGIILARTGESLIVNTPNGKVTVMLTDYTRTKDDKGLFGLQKQTLSNVVLIPGLKVDIEGTSDPQGRVVAKTITVDGDDLETAEMIQAGLHPTAEQVAANVQTLEQHRQGISTNSKDIAANQRDIAANQQGVADAKAQLGKHKESIESNQQNIAEHTQKIDQNMKEIRETTDRFNALTDYDVKEQATVKFALGSSRIAPADQERLKQLAQTATALNGYIIEVVGYTDSTGSAEVNTKLSEDRAKAVVTCLIQQGKVPIRHVVAPGAMGEYGATATNESQAGRAENRRVEVKVLINKGISGS